MDCSCVGDRQQSRRRVGCSCVGGWGGAVSTGLPRGGPSRWRVHGDSGQGIGGSRERVGAIDGKVADRA
eukprot:3458307-Rhodomonas_salina.2